MPRWVKLRTGRTVGVLHHDEDGGLYEHDGNEHDENGPFGSDVSCCNVSNGKGLTKVWTIWVEQLFISSVGYDQITAVSLEHRQQTHWQILHPAHAARKQGAVVEV
jgi:hypothetical protein